MPLTNPFSGAFSSYRLIPYFQLLKKRILMSTINPIPLQKERDKEANRAALLTAHISKTNCEASFIFFNILKTL